MSESGFTNIPPAPRSPADIPARGEKSSVTGDLIGVPRDVRIKAQRAQQAVRVKGEVVHNRDNGPAGREVRIRTEHGDVDVRIPPSQNKQAQNLKVGQTVDVNIKIEQNGEASVTIQPAKVQPKQTEAPPRQTPERNIPVTPEMMAKIKLAEIERNAPQTITPQTTVPNGLPPAGSTIRIEPVAAQQIQETLSNPIKLIAAQVTQSTQLSTALITLDATVEQTQNLLQTLQTNSGPALSSTTLLNVPAERPSAAQGPVAGTTLPLQGPETLSPKMLEMPLTTDSIAAPFHTPSALESLKTEQQEKPLFLTAKIENVSPPVATLTETGDAKTPIPNQVTENIRPGQITATVTGFTDRGLPVLELATPLSGLPQNFVLQTTDTEHVVQGSRLTLSPLPQSAGIQQTITSAAMQHSALFTSGAWPVMQEVFQTLSQSAPALAASLASVTPSPANANAATQITPAALFFIAALRSGDMASWLGDKALDVLRRDGKGNLLSRLGSEISALSRTGAEPVAQDWRGMSIPMMWQNEMQKIALFYKHDDSGSEDKESGAGKTRFIFDLDLTRMGKVQLDGLLRGTKLDLIVRTGETFSQTMQQEMRGLYTNALEQAQMSGELSFTAKPEQWVKVNIEDKTSKITA